MKEKVAGRSYVGFVVPFKFTMRTLGTDADNNKIRNGSEGLTEPEDKAPQQIKQHFIPR